MLKKEDFIALGIIGLIFLILSTHQLNRTLAYCDKQCTLNTEKNSPEYLASLRQEETETQTETETETHTQQQYKSLGVFKITAYCECEKCCGVWATKRENDVVVGASGEQLIANYSIATDPNIIPLGSKVYINNKEYVAQDTGGAIKGNRIDLYMSTHQEALIWGVREIEVFVKE